MITQALSFSLNKKEKMQINLVENTMPLVSMNEFINGTGDLILDKLDKTNMYIFMQQDVLPGYKDKSSA